MGLFGGDSKSSKTEKNSQQSTGFSEIANGRLNSLNASGDSSVYLHQSDEGAINSAFQFALKSQRETNAGATKMGLKALDANARAVQEGYNLARDSTSKVASFGRDSMAFNESVISKALNFISSANRQNQEAVQDTTRQLTNKFADYANRQTATTDDKIIDVAKWGIGAMAAMIAWNTWNARKR